MNTLKKQMLDYQQIEKALRFLNSHTHEKPRIEAVAEHLAVSPAHLKRLCARWAGAGPEKLLALLEFDRFKEMLKGKSTAIAEALPNGGLSGADRLGKSLANLVTIEPEEHKTDDRSLRIRYGFHPTPFGRALICVAGPGVCGLSFVDKEEDTTILAYQKRRWPLSEFIPDDADTAEYISRIFSIEKESHRDEPLNCFLRGTSFQCKVWKALLRVLPGNVTTYANIAAAAGRATAVRAAANAVGLNPVAFLIPCHRVIRTSGELGGYRWGTLRKQAMLVREFAGCSAAGEDRLPVFPE